MTHRFPPNLGEGSVLSSEPFVELSITDYCTCQTKNSNWLSHEKIIDYELNSCIEGHKSKNNLSGRRTKPLRGRNKGWCEAPFL